MTRRQLLAALPLALAAPAAAQGERKRIEGLYLRVARLLEKKDIDAVMKMTAKDVVLLGPGGVKVTRDEWQAQMRQFFAGARGVKMRMKVLDCRVQGATAVLTARQELAATIQGQDGKPHALKVIDLSRDTLARSGGTWILKRSETMEHRELLDGKPAPAAPPAKG